MTKKEIFEFSKENNCALVEDENYFNELIKGMAFNRIQLGDEKLNAWFLRGNFVGFTWHDKEEKKDYNFVRIYLGKR